VVFGEIWKRDEHMDWEQLVEEISTFAETLKDKSTTVDINADDSYAEIWLIVGGTRYKLYLSEEH
jgi:hypothetical protein